MPKTGTPHITLKTPFRTIANDQRPDFRSFLLAIANCIPDMQKQVLGTENLPDAFTYPENNDAQRVGLLDQLLHNLGCSSGPDGYVHVGTKIPDDQTIHKLTELSDDLVAVMNNRHRALYKANKIPDIEAFQMRYHAYSRGLEGLRDILHIRDYRANKKQVLRTADQQLALAA